MVPNKGIEYGLNRKYPDEAQRKRVRWEEEEQGSGRNFSRQREMESSGLCDDDMQEQGISRILTINLNDVEKELNIK